MSRLLGMSVVLAVAVLSGAAAAASAIQPAEFAELHALVKPHPGESKWATVPWMTNLQAARERSAAEGKPIFVWRAGGGEVLGRA
jgi:hypothetical protein